MTRAGAAALATALALAAAGIGGCEEGRGTACTDRDDDGFGPGCPAGPDCDDEDPARVDDCPIRSPEECAPAPLSPGCPCLPGAREACFSGPPAAEGVGACRPGVLTCRSGGFWSTCEGEVAPTDEVCNLRDDDCDGRVDEGVQSPCGGCDAGCLGVVWGADGAFPFEPAGDLVVDEAGRLGIARDPTMVREALWVPSADDGLVTKIDTATGAILARYRSGGASPARVAVDHLGDAWVANRAFAGQASVTRIVGDPARCPDRNGEPGVQTSTGAPLAQGEDECVVLTAPVGDVGAIARAIAIDGTVGLDGAAGGGHPWVGLFGEEAVVELDPATGAVLDRVDTPGVAPFDAAFDDFGVLWVLDRDGMLARVDRGRRPRVAETIVLPRTCFLSHGLAIDADDRVVVAGFSCDLVHRYDPEADRWATVAVEESPRGVAVAGDEVWVSHAAGLLSRLAAADLRVRDVIDLWDLGRAPVESMGVAVDDAGEPWVLSGAGGEAGAGLATRVDPGVGAVARHVSVGQRPEVLGDPTGARLRGGFRSGGTLARVFDGCGAGVDTAWRRLHVDTRVGGPGTVTIAVRQAADRAGLAAVEPMVVARLPADADPVPLDVPDGGVLEVSLTLETPDRDGAPRVDRVGVEWGCGGLG